MKRILVIIFPFKTYALNQHAKEGYLLHTNIIWILGEVQGCVPLWNNRENAFEGEQQQQFCHSWWLCEQKQLQWSPHEDTYFHSNLHLVLSQEKPSAE